MPLHGFPTRNHQLIFVDTVGFMRVYGTFLEKFIYDLAPA